MPILTNATLQNMALQIANGTTKDMASDITNEVAAQVIPENLVEQIITRLLEIQSIISSNKLFLSMLLSGMLLVLVGMYISIYKKAFSSNRNKLALIINIKYLKYIELITNRYPFKILSRRLENSISYFMFDYTVARYSVAIFTLILPIVGVLLYSALTIMLNIWYTRLITFVLCIMLPYYIFTLILDYMKYCLRLKIPLLIDSFRSSFMKHYRIKPALQECSINIDKELGRIMRRVSDSSDLNESLCIIRDRINDTWFNVFILLLVNYRENGGELIGQLYKLNISITRYNNIEKKKNKRLIWYEVFTVLASIFSLPIIILMNKMILGFSVGLYYDTTAAFAKVVIYSLAALLVVRILRRM